jgi:ABC-2 type transport system permease protein
LSNESLGSIAQTLAKNYDVKRQTIDGKIDALMHRTQDTTKDVKVFPTYDAIIIAKPMQPFDEKDKFLIDQYIMHGGKVLWLVEPVYATMDSLQNQESTIAMELDLNLDDMLFRYGVRLNRDLLLAWNCAQIAVRTGGMVGNQPQYTRFKWYYFPLLQAASDHPMVRNMNGIKADFVSSMDATTSANGVEQIPLLKTTGDTKVSGAPVFITLAMLRQAPDQRMFNVKGGKNVAYLLKGNFTSLYANRIPQEIVDDQATDFMEESVPTAMIVVADGDLISNQFDIDRNPLPLGYDKYTGITYTNKEFIENAVSYLVDGESMIDIRSRKLTIRLLDTKKVNSERMKWQVINTVMPIALIILFGVVLALVRKNKYSKTEHHEEK